MQRLLDAAMLTARILVCVHTQCSVYARNDRSGAGKEAAVIDTNYSASAKNSDKFTVLFKGENAGKNSGGSERVFCIIKCTYSPPNQVAY